MPWYDVSIPDSFPFPLVFPFARPSGPKATFSANAPLMRLPSTLVLVVGAEDERNLAAFFAFSSVYGSCSALSGAHSVATMAPHRLVRRGGVPVKFVHSCSVNGALCGC